MAKKKARSVLVRYADVPTAAQRYEAGKALRDKVPRSSHAVWETTSKRDPIALFTESNKTRLQDLVPIRYGRMATSPFAFYRGSAVLMAHDLSSTPVSGIKAQICGDAHLANFGLFATPERNVIFDVNDFDETLRGPWEWDLKRLAASCFIAARDNGLRRRQSREIAQVAAFHYRAQMNSLAKVGYLDVWYSRIDIRTALEIVPRSYVKAARHEQHASIHRTTHHGFPSFVVRKAGSFRIEDEAPLVAHLSDAERARRLVQDIIRYRDTLENDRQMLLSRYHLVDFATKVVGVGSVGTRCYVALFMGRDKTDPLLLQIKEAQASVLERYLGKSRYSNHGERVVHGQRLMQAASDMFLGWARGLYHDYYVRQLRDMKYSATVQTMDRQDLADYAALCGRTLARAHARSGNPSMIAGYVGNGDALDRALGEFAESYAEQNEQDYNTLLEALRTKRLKATHNM